MKEQWVNAAVKFSSDKEDMYTGCRKILRAVQFETDLQEDLQLADAGYTTHKLHHLRRHYLHQESKDMALELLFNTALVILPPFLCKIKKGWISQPLK